MAFFQLFVRFLICPLHSVLVRKKYRSLGCYRESPRRRLLPVLEKNFRPSIKWTAIDELVEDCYEIVKKTHYKVFGFKFYGECWVGERPEPQYKTSMDRCFLHVVGKAHSYYVYEVVQVYEIGESLLTSLFTFFLITIRLNSQKPQPYIRIKCKSRKS